ncbi:MAG: glycosyltransferase, partial [Candidatus Jordarchaeaceae archaeon]
MSRDTGASVRIYNLSNELISLGHDVQLVIPGYERKTMRISGLTVHVLNGIFPCRFLKAISELIKVLKPTALFFYDIFFIKRAYPLIRESEIIQVEQPIMSGLLVPIIAKVFKKPIVVDCHDVFQALRIANIGYIRKILETIVERVVYKFASVILTVSEKEKQFLLSLGIDKYKIKVIPNGVDTTVFARSVDYMGIRKRFGLTDKRVIVFVGNLEYPPNKEAVRLIALKIAPKVIDFVGNATFLIVGRKNNIVYPNLSFTGVVNDVISVLLVSDCAIA